MGVSAVIISRQKTWNFNKKFWLGKNPSASTYYKLRLIHCQKNIKILSIIVEVNPECNFVIQELYNRFNVLDIKFREI